MACLAGVLHGDDMRCLFTRSLHVTRAARQISSNQYIRIECTLEIIEIDYMDRITVVWISSLIMH